MADIGIIEKGLESNPFAALSRELGNHYTLLLNKPYSMEALAIWENKVCEGEFIVYNYETGMVKVLIGETVLSPEEEIHFTTIEDFTLVYKTVILPDMYGEDIDLEKLERRGDMNFEDSEDWNPPGSESTEEAG